LHLALPIAGEGYDVTAFAPDLAGFADAGRPVVVSCPLPTVAQPFVDQRLPLFASEPEAVRALATFLGQRQRAAVAAARRPLLPVRRPSTATVMLDEAASMSLVASAGVRVVDHRVCRDADEAVAAFEAFGGEAVVVKGCSSKLAHKSDLGLVRLGLRSAEAVRAAFGDIETVLGTHDPDASGVIIAGMVAGRRELIVGARHDPAFGPTVVVGDGGVYAEVMPDAAVLLAPFDDDEARAALDRLRIAPVLAGARGEPPMDVEAVVSLLAAVGRLITDESAGVTELDLNPVMLKTVGEGCVAADAVVFREA
jgi:acetate---CoA ligase (ADP-forming)